MYSSVPVTARADRQAAPTMNARPNLIPKSKGVPVVDDITDMSVKIAAAKIHLLQSPPVVDNGHFISYVNVNASIRPCPTLPVAACTRLETDLRCLTVSTHQRDFVSSCSDPKVLHVTLTLKA